MKADNLKVILTPQSSRTRHKPKYSIAQMKGDSIVRIVCYLNDHLKYSEGVGQGIISALDKSNIILNLEI